MIILKPWALYNEIDEYAAEWTENLIRLGLVAPGIVDRRSIIDICPDELRGFRQCHFFAGIAVWSYALRRAGVSDDTALWTGSAPCQPFSAAGAGGGVDDERHLWPHWFHLIRAARPPRIYGEQVASKDGLGWLDLVQADLEGEDYSVWAVDTCSAGGGAPHIRQRLRLFAEDIRSSASGLVDGLSSGLEGLRRGHRTEAGQREGPLRPVATTGGIEWVADDLDNGQWQLGHRFGSAPGAGEGDAEQWERLRTDPTDGSPIERLADADGGNTGSKGIQRGWEQRQQSQNSSRSSRTAPAWPGPTNGFWGSADWLFCRDGKWRPTQPSTFPLVDGSAFRLGSGSPFEGKSRQGMLKGYGNAIDAEATVDFIEATLKADTIDTLGTDIDELL